MRVEVDVKRNSGYHDLVPEDNHAAIEEAVMDLYLISLIVGGFFVLLSLLGGGDTDTDADFDTDFDADVDLDLDFDADVDVDADMHLGGSAADIGAGPGLVDLFSIRALFLFAAFFGLTGTLLSLLGTGEPITAVLAVLTGLIVGLGGNYLIKRIGYAQVSSGITVPELHGKTAEVMLPFAPGEKGKVKLVVKGHQLQLIARGMETDEALFSRGDVVVVVRMEDGIAEVVKPN